MELQVHMIFSKSSEIILENLEWNTDSLYHSSSY